MEGLKGRVGFVAIGAYGGNQGELFSKAGYSVVFINTAQQDLDSLTDIPDSDKYHIPGGEGCSKDRSKSKTIFSEDLDNVINVIKDKLVGLDYIFIIGSCGGGTGSGILASMKRIIVSELEPKACMVITVLPNTRTESLKALENAYNTLCEIEQLEEPGATFILDNDRLGDKLKINELFFTYLDALLTNNSTSKYGNADTEEIQVMLQTPGIAVITLLDRDKTNTQQIINSFQNNIYAPLEEDKVLTYSMIICAGLGAGVNTEEINAEFGKPYDCFRGYESDITICMLSGLSLPYTKLKEIQKQLESSKDTINRNRAAKSEKRLTSKFEFFEPVKEEAPKTTKKKCSRDLLF